MENRFKKHDYNKKKVIISLIFGLIGFWLNSSPIKIYQFQDIRIDVLFGLLFPLIITLAWGWKYGLISSIFGGCQTMWILWFEDGYGMLYSVPIFTLWIVYHGIISDLRKTIEIEKWYYNKYIAEIIFRIIVFFGFCTIFVWLISLNPPFWTNKITTNFISTKWLELLLIKHIIEGYFLILLADVLLRLDLIRKLLDLDRRNKDKNYIIIISMFVGFVACIIDALALTYVNSNNNRFLENLIFKIEPRDFLLRLFIITLFIIIGLIVSDFYENNKNKRIEIEKQYDAINNILNLISSIGKTGKVDEKIFMYDLLETAIDIIPEAEYGIAYIYEYGYGIPVSVVGHDKELLNDIKIKDIFTPKDSEKIFVVKEFKEIMIEHTSIEMQDLVSKYIKEIKETMFIILSLNNKKIASISIDIPSISNETFSKESIQLANSLKNIPVAFFNQIKKYELKQDLYKEIIMSIIKILSLHNPYTKEHSVNVAKISSEIATSLGMSRSEVDTVYWTGLVHDIGKILIPDNILEKKEKLTREEYEIVMKHTVWGYETLISNEGLSNIAKYVLYHHERWDGNGYPEGIKENEIPKISRIIAVADTYDAMTSDRSYRKALSKKIALQEIINNAGTQFDPEVVKVFVTEVLYNKSVFSTI